MFKQQIESEYTSSKVENVIQFNRSKKALLKGKDINYFCEHLITASPIVRKAFIDIYREYNEAFSKYVIANTENEYDYKYTRFGGTYRNIIVQIDINALPVEIFMGWSDMSQTEVTKYIKSRIFEVENNWAAYKAHGTPCKPERVTSYRDKTITMLDEIRESTGKKIVLLAVTDEKYLSILESEFGMEYCSHIFPEIACKEIGFDGVWGAREFIYHVEDKKDIDSFLFYVRTSNPPRKLRNPNEDIVHPILGISKYREILKRQSLTFNIDNPGWEKTDGRNINDSKKYMVDMGIAEILDSPDDIFLLRGKYGGMRIRAKPSTGSYGCYGHLSGFVDDKKFRYSLRKGIKEWGGGVVVQPEYEPPAVINSIDGKEYVYMDRVFCGILNGAEEYFGGQRIYVPKDSFEVKKRRLHIVDEAVLGEIE